MREGIKGREGGNYEERMTGESERNEERVDYGLRTLIRVSRLNRHVAVELEHELIVRADEPVREDAHAT